jgi:hypothetical protein
LEDDQPLKVAKRKGPRAPVFGHYELIPLVRLLPPQCQAVVSASEHPFGEHNTRDVGLVHTSRIGMASGFNNGAFADSHSCVVMHLQLPERVVVSHHAMIREATSAAQDASRQRRARSRMERRSRSGRKRQEHRRNLALNGSRTGIIGRLQQLGGARSRHSARRL